MVEFKWRAWYSDGTYLDQGKNQYEKIERDRLNAFEIYRDGKSLLRVWLDDDRRKKLIYRRRPSVNMAGEIVTVVYLVGWHMKVGNESIQSINYIFEDGRVEQAGKWVGKLPVFREEEKLNGG